MPVSGLRKRANESFCAMHVLCIAFDLDRAPKSTRVVMKHADLRKRRDLLAAPFCLNVVVIFGSYDSSRNKDCRRAVAKYREIRHTIFENNRVLNLLFWSWP